MKIIKNLLKLLFSKKILISITTDEFGSYIQEQVYKIRLKKDNILT